MKKTLRSSEMSVLTRATWRNIPEDGILQDIIAPHQQPLRYTKLYEKHRRFIKKEVHVDIK
jgi:hypothetical protein